MDPKLSPTSQNQPNQTIAAIATPLGKGGIGIIKLSGHSSIPIALQIFQGQDAFETHKLYYGCIVDPDSPSSSGPIDEVLLTAMFAPHSYTCEDVVEIQTHCNNFILETILKLVFKLGAVPAQPGEFTRRAFLNGRIDLSQAESVIDLININNQTALRIASQMMRGKIKERISILKQQLTQLSADLNAAIDFPDASFDNDLETINKVEISMTELINNHKKTRHYCQDLKVIIVGKPNVGKSSLFNCLVDEHRAIVTDIPGTTRDIIDKTITLGGFNCQLSDTAGLHQSNDTIENMGIAYTKKLICKSDLILFVLDASRPLSLDDINIYNTIKAFKFIIVVNKSDIATADFKNQIPVDISISALLRQGIEQIKNKIQALFSETELICTDYIAPNLRQANLLESAMQNVKRAKSELEGGCCFDLVAEDISATLRLLGEISGGQVNNEDILDNIFTKFCIGK